MDPEIVGGNSDTNKHEDGEDTEKKIPTNHHGLYGGLDGFAESRMVHEEGRKLVHHPDI